MGYLATYYTMCDVCGRRDISGPWLTTEEADARSYLVKRDGKHYCWSDCDPERCTTCNGNGELRNEEGFFPKECPACHGAVIRERAESFLNDYTQRRRK